jgi:hypothetical protein
MQRKFFSTLSIAVAVFAIAQPARAEDWAAIKGRIVFDGDPPKQAPIPAAAATQDKATCLKDKSLLTEEWVVDPKSKGIRDIFVWLAPDVDDRKAPFDVKKIHEKLLPLKEKNVTIEQPCCRFIPHGLIARAGQTLTIDGSPAIAHNAKYESGENGAGNPIIPAGGKFVLPNPLKADPGLMIINCNIHPWMKSVVKVVDHPYYAVTNEKGEFVIELAPVGKFRLYIQHPDNGYLGGAKGRFGQPITVNAKGTDLGTIKWK